MERIRANIQRLLDRADDNQIRILTESASAMVGVESENLPDIMAVSTDRQLRVIYLLAYDIVKNSHKQIIPDNSI